MASRIALNLGKGLGKGLGEELYTAMGKEKLQQKSKEMYNTGQNMYYNNVSPAIKEANSHINKNYNFLNKVATSKPGYYGGKKTKRRRIKRKITKIKRTRTKRSRRN